MKRNIMMKAILPAKGRVLIGEKKAERRQRPCTPDVQSFRNARNICTAGVQALVILYRSRAIIAQAHRSPALQPCNSYTTPAKVFFNKKLF
jgi:hypothetical protein